MRQKLLVTVLLLSSIIKLYSQDYIPMLGDYNTWTYTPTLYSDVVYDIHTEDSLFNSTLYKKVKLSDQFEPSCMGLLREDVQEQQVWYVEPGSDTERIIYDFSLEEGDSIYLQFNAGIQDYILNDGWYFVDSIRTRTIMNIDRRVFYLDNPLNENIGGSYFERPFIKWIEGVGSNLHPIYFSSRDLAYDFPEANYVGGGFVICAFIDGQHIYQDYYIEVYELNCDLTVGIMEEDRKILYTFFPNPASDRLIVSFKNYATIKSFSLYNILGKRIKQVVVDREEISIDISDLKKGVYFISSSNQNKISTVKFIKK